MFHLIYSKMETSYTTSGWFICLSIILFTLWSSHCTRSQPYTIVVPKNSSCPSNSTCFTLAEYASTTYINHSKVVSLKLLPGNHTLDVKMVINNIQKFSLYADAYSVSWAKGTIIGCSPSAGIQFSSCHHVYISNLQFSGCTDNVIESVNNFTIIFSSFVGIGQFGSALIINHTSHLTILHTHFVLNSGITRNMSIFMSEKQKGIINAILCDAVMIMNSSFVKNTQSVLIFAQHMTNISIKNSCFEKNTIEAVILAKFNSSVLVSNSIFFKNSFFGGAFMLQVFDSMLQVLLTEVSHNDSVGSGGGMYAVRSIIAIEKSTFKQFNGSHNGGVIACFGGNISIFATVFEQNAASDQGGVLYANSTNVIIKESLFRFNHALVGGVLALHWGTVTVNASKFTSNRAWASDMTVGGRGGAVVIDRAVVNISNSQFEDNYAASGGAIEFYYSTFSTLLNTGFYFNMAKYNGIVYIDDCKNLTGLNVTFEYNNGQEGVVYVAESKVYFITFSYKFNNGSIILLGSRLLFSKKCVFSNNMPEYVIKSFRDQGGVITSFQSTLVFATPSNIKFIDNHARLGGAIHAIDSLINIFSDVLLSGNEATESGGGIYLYETDVQILCNLSLQHNVGNNSGGGVYFVGGSLVLFPGYLTSCTTARVSILDNSASNGGGLYLSNHAKLYIFGDRDNKVFELLNNHADYGGALYIADDTNTGICYRSSDDHHATTSNSECFFQNLVFDYHTVSYNKSTLHKQGFFQFQNNTARYAGNNLFGGLLDRCSLNPYGNILLQDNDTGPNSYLEYLIQDSLDLESISSYPVRMCLCIDDQPDCNNQPSIVHVQKGKLFNISVVAVDQVNHTINASVLCTLSSPEAGLGEGQLSQSSFKDCTSLKFQIFSPYELENLTLYADGPCKDARLSRLRIPIVFSPCKCPIGFQPIRTQETLCGCECDYRLQHYGIHCNLSSQSVVRDNSYWIDHVNMTKDLNGFIYYAYCPYDYCLPSSLKLNIDFKIRDGADAQCAFNRTGILCGACKPGLSLSLGSSRCIKCSTTWSVSMIFVFLGSAFAGILLVAIIMILDLTVATGTINGFIFYANIIGAYSRTYLPFVRPNFCTIFIAWFNLELGFDLCFFEGMDAYTKTWLQLSFPVYLFLIVGATIFISNRSSRFSQFIGKKNPVATLATVILLAFTKVLHSIIAIFSFAVLKYPNNSSIMLWLLDASVKYLKGKHFPLFLVATLIILIDFVFILLLLFWQLILFGSNVSVLRWSKNTRIHNFIDSYLAPYTPKFRFWTGLLLLARVIIYLVSTANMSDDPVTDLIAVGIVMMFIFLLKFLFREKMYQKLSAELLETACYFNLFLFTILSFLSFKSPWHQRIFARVSVGIIFTAFLFVFVCHVYCTLRQLNIFGRLIALIIAKVKRKHNNLGHDLKLQDDSLNLLPASSLAIMDSCPFYKCNEINEDKNNEKEVHKGIRSRQVDPKGSFDPLGSIREPLLEQAL